ncbi:MAG: hypothetical protein Q8K99_07730 [Actinomycetota bacterium]|nr:hypothetical protein [Actinomycetota bacterium]
MVDDMTPQDSSLSPAEAAPVSGVPEKAGDFLSTSTGKLIVIGGAVLAFLVVAGLVAWAVFMFVLEPSSSPDTVGANDAAAGSKEATASADAIIEPGGVPLSDLFTFRDVFEPLIVTPDASELETTTGSPTSTTATSDSVAAPDTSSQTLYLQDIISDNGVARAVLVFEGQEYTLAEGESIPGSPWEVLTIGTTSVTMLYGDVQVTISIGQGVTK